MFLSKEARILNILLKHKGKPVHMRLLNAIAYRYPARIWDLKRKGYRIDTIQIGHGNFSYRLNA